MLRLLPLSLLLVLLTAAGAQAATVKVAVPAEGQMTVAVATVAKKSSVKAKAPAGIAVTGSVKKGRLGVAVLHRRGVAAGGVVTLKVKGKVRGLKTSASAGACKTLAALLAKPLQSAGLAASDLRTAGAAAAARACGKPMPAGAQAVLDRLGLGDAPPAGGGIAAPGAGRPVPPAGGGGGSTNQCSNGIDDDGDGTADAREFGTDPDPGCSGPADESEDSEVGLPAGCSVGGGNLDSDPRFPAIELAGCGAVTGVWFKPSAPPSDCLFAIGAGGGQACALTGATAGATFAATTANVVLGTHTTTDTTCGPVTIAISLANGQVANLRDDWC